MIPLPLNPIGPFLGSGAIKIKKFDSKAEAETFIDGLDLTFFLDAGWKAICELSNLLYAALSALTETVPHPIYFKLPVSKLAWMLVDEEGDIHDFRITYSPIETLIIPIQIGLHWYVFYPDVGILNPDLVGSNLLYYWLNDEDGYRQGTYYEPDHYTKLIEISIDGLLIFLLIYAIYWLSTTGLESVSLKLAELAFKGASTLNLNNHLRNISAKVDDTNAKINDQAVGLSKIAANLTTAINTLDEIQDTIDLNTEDLALIKNYCSQILTAIGVKFTIS